MPIARFLITSSAEPSVQTCRAGASRSFTRAGAHGAIVRMLSRALSRARYAALLGALSLAVAACSEDNSTAGTDDEDVVVLVGERAGLMVWRPYDGATSYRVELFTAEDRLEHSATTSDTVGAYPPGFDAGTGKTWQVRAFNGERQVARSIKAPVY